jgi:4-alpha-glucanotransferase
VSEGPLARRRAGVLLHPTSLPSPYGAGDFGHAAWRFVEFLAGAGFGVWQVLPLGPVHSEGSPYNALSVHAGNPALISVDWLCDRGYLQRVDLEGLRDGSLRRDELLAEAARRFARRCAADAALEARFLAFRARSAPWLPDYALYVALREAHGDLAWQRWPRPLREREPAALEHARGTLAGRCDALAFEQFVFDQQWHELRAWARAHGVLLFGDLPIFVAPDSAEVWARRGLFRLDAEGWPQVETGVPPDYFSANGQRWGNPHYDWEAMAGDGFAWWRARLATQRARFDLLRIDHFRGFEACWEIPRAAARAAEGCWRPAPGDALLGALVDVAGAGTLVAENLGLITPAVEALRGRWGLPGMRVLQFGFDGDPANPHLPHNHDADEVVYTGTHDNDTTLGWLNGLDPVTRDRVLDYLGRPGEPMPRPLLRAALGSVARLAVLPLQDLLGLDSDARMNVPGVATGNWSWQFDAGATGAELARELRGLLSLYGRIPQA